MVCEPIAHRVQASVVVGFLVLLGLGVNLFHVQGFCLRDQILKSSGRKGAGVTEDQDTFAEDHQGRDRRNLSGSSKFLLCIGVDLAENNIFVALMTQLPTWADGLPLDADGY